MDKKDILFTSSGLFSLFIWNSYLSLNGFFESTFESTWAIKVIVTSFTFTGLIFIFLNEIYFSRLNYYILIKFLLHINNIAFILVYFVCSYVRSKLNVFRFFINKLVFLLNLKIFCKFVNSLVNIKFF